MIKINYVSIIFLILSINSEMTTTKEKYSFLLEQTLNIPSGLIKIDELSAKRYLIDHPRNYDLFVMFTTEKCLMCKKIVKHVEKISKTFKANKMYLPRKQKDSKKLKKPIFFLLVDLKFEDREISTHYHIVTLPSVILSLSHEIYIKDNFKRKQYFDEYFWRITSQDGTINAEILLRWLNRVSGNQIEIKQPVWVFFIVIFILFLILGILTLFYILAQGCILHEKFWLLGCMVFFFVFAGGSYFTVARGVPFVGEENGSLVFVRQGSRSQYGIEGPMIMGLCALCCFGLVFLNFVMKTRVNILVKAFFFFVIMIAIIRGVKWLETVFKSKNFYNPSFEPPSYYIKGSYYKDQGIIQ